MIFFCCFFHRHFSSPSHFNGVVTKGIVSSNRLLFLRIRINTQTLKEIHNTYSSTLILLAKFYGLKKPNMYFIMKMITKPIVLTYNFWTQYMAIYPWTEDSKNNSTELSSKVLELGILNYFLYILQLNLYALCLVHTVLATETAATFSTIYLLIWN